MSQIVHAVKREPVTVLTVVAVLVQGVLEAAQESGVTTWGQLVSVLVGVIARYLVTPVAAPRLPEGPA